jgi:REP element-mobilizing transposase RayT
LYEKIGNEARPQLGKIKSKSEKIVEVVSYCLNPNHYHLILKQLEDRGIEKFMQRLGTSHAMYFNKKYKRSGTLFQGPFKSIHIDSNEYLIYLSAYVNKNNFIHGYTADDSWKYSSLNDFLGKSKNEFVNVNPVLSQFRNIKDYEKYLNKNASHFKSKKEMEDHILEGDSSLEARPLWRPHLQKTNLC